MQGFVGYQLSVILTLGGLCAVLYLFLRYSKSLQKRRFSGEMQIIDRLAIDAGATLVIVDVKGEQMLLSVSGKETRLLKTFPK
jgi:flagellar biogenesis protein FliO